MVQGWVAAQDDLASTLSRQNTEQPETEVRVTVTLGEAYTRYIDDPTHCWSASTRQAYETARKIAVSVLGADIAINSLARAHCGEYCARHPNLLSGRLETLIEAAGTFGWPAEHKLPRN